MATTATVYTVFIAAPTEVAAEKLVVQAAIRKWNEEHGRRRRVVLQPAMWETDAAAEMGAPPQEILNHQLVDHCDILIGLFWKELGTPTVKAESGTVEEIERAISHDKRVSVLFKNALVDPKSFDQGEFQRVEAFKAKVNGLYAEFDSGFALESHVMRALTRHVDALEQIGGPGGPSTTTASPTSTASVTSAAGDVTAIATVVESAATERPSSYELARAGKYKEGLAALGVEPGGAASLRATAFIQAIAFMEGGVLKAFNDLEALASAHPKDGEVQTWYAFILDRQDRTAEAIALLERSLALADETGTGRSVAAVLARLYADAGFEDKAIALLKARIVQEVDPKRKARLLNDLASIFEERGTDEGKLTSIMYSELAVDVLPSDNELRDQLARRYGDQSDGDALAFYHHRQSIQSEDDSSARTNAGYHASRLGMPITAADYYREAAKKNEPFAIANTALALLEAGFREEAEEVIARARRAGETHVQIDRAKWRISEATEAESKLLEETLDLVAAHRQWVLKRAKASLREPNLPIAKSFTGDGLLVRLNVQESKEVTGTMILPDGRPASLSGVAIGAALDIRWATLASPTAPSSPIRELMIGKKDSIGALLASVTTPSLKGHAFFVLHEHSLEGYWTEADDPNALNAARSFKKIRLSETDS